MNTSSRQVPIVIRREVRNRDRNKCRKCGRKEGLEFHHIISFGEMGRNNKWKEVVHQKNNLILLCSNCGYEWETDSKLLKVTCPSCQNKTKRTKPGV